MALPRRRQSHPPNGMGSSDQPSWSLLSKPEGPGASKTRKLESAAGSSQALLALSVYCFILFIYCLFLGGGSPMAYGGSQARGPTGAVAAILCHSHSHARSEPRL